MTWSLLFFTIWAVALLLAIWGVNIAQRFCLRVPRLVRRPIGKTGGGGRTPRVAIIVPIKGVEDDTASNVAALLEQDYPDYRIIFTVESNEDPVLSLLERLALDNSRIEIVVAGLSHDRGQKIHNQLAAVERTTEDDEILAFMDADAKPEPEWLRALITPLTYGPHIGATTGYRYYIPVTAHPANKIVSVLNAKVAALLGPYRRNFAWGGSMALRRLDFFNYGLRDLWQHALSDDYVLSHCVKKIARKKIHFVPRCLVASDANFNWASLFEFAVRQYRITKVCAASIWLTGIAGALLYLTALSYTFFNTLYGFIRPDVFHGWEHLRQITMFLSLYILSVVRGYFLVRGGEKLLPAHTQEIRSTTFWATFGAPWMYLIDLLALLGAACGRTIVWRGISYRMLSSTQTIVQRPHVSAAPAPRRETADLEQET